MKIAEMNNCIGKMREIYKFDDENTEIRLGRLETMRDDTVNIYTKDENGTEISLSRRIDEPVEIE